MTHVPRRNDADPDWQEIHAVAEAQEPALARLLRLVFAAMASRLVLRRLRSALQLGNLEAVLQAIPVADLLTATPAVEAVLREVATGGARISLESELVVRLGSSAGLPVAELAFWARQHAGALVVGITTQTRLALRETIAQALERGLSPATAAPLIEAVIGLNSVQARALLRRLDDLLASDIPADRWLPLLRRYAAQLIRQRAQVIARHELLTAANAGRRAQWARNVRDGLIAPDRWEREWVAIVPSDGRTCVTCIDLDGQRAPINGVYPSGEIGPPAHVLCRCTEVLVRISAA